MPNNIFAADTVAIAYIWFIIRFNVYFGYALETSQTDSFYEYLHHFWSKLDKYKIDKLQSYLYTRAI